MKKFSVPKNKEEIMAWINTVPMYKEDQPLDLSFKSKDEIFKEIVEIYEREASK